MSEKKPQTTMEWIDWEENKGGDERRLAQIEQLVKDLKVMSDDTFDDSHEVDRAHIKNVQTAIDILSAVIFRVSKRIAGER